MSWLTIAGVYLCGVVSGFVVSVSMALWFVAKAFPPERTEG